MGSLPTATPCLISMLPIRVLRLVVVALAVVAIACGDPTKPKPTFLSSANAYTLYPLQGSPPATNNAILFLGGATRASGSFQFDVALDLDATGKAVVYPVRLLAGTIAGTVKRVGLQPVAGSFSALQIVPDKGYDTLTAQVVSPGTVLAVELQDVGTCQFSRGGSLIYAKFVVDSINATSRRIFARAVVDPNCGYREVVQDSLPNS